MIKPIHMSNNQKGCHWHSGKLTVELVSKDSVVSIIPSGELDIAGAKSLRDAIDQAVKTQPRLIVLDLSNVTFIDASGISACVTAKSFARSKRIRFKVTNASSTVKKVVAISGTTSLL